MEVKFWNKEMTSISSEVADKTSLILEDEETCFRVRLVKGTLTIFGTYGQMMIIAPYDKQKIKIRNIDIEEE